ncbi:MAG: phosphoserine phosphatase SerB [Alphaproteobacteria bacterium]|nr:phosphoserine phosphatase SerB [Alphaproteobacteria bacterium]
MDTVLLLIASRQGPGIPNEAVAAALSALTGAGDARRLAPEAVEILLQGPIGTHEDDVRAALDGWPIDVAHVPAAGRAKKLLIADMDSTFIHQECIDELGKMAGAGDQIAAITERAMRGEFNFEQALRERVAFMEGLDASAIETVKKEHITFTDGGRALVQGMRSAGAYTALVSGGFTHFTEFVAGECGFHEHRANRLIIDGQTLTGKVEEPALGLDAKVSALHEMCGRLSITPGDVLAVGDGANDIGMLGLAGMGVAFHGKPAVREAAGIKLDHAGLDGLLWLQGLGEAPRANT